MALLRRAAAYALPVAGAAWCYQTLQQQGALPSWVRCF
jgi:hypothetical protein